jgi:hypothetical protein
MSMNISHESIETHVVNGKAPLAAAQGLPPERLAPQSQEPTAGEYALSVSTLVEQCRREIQAYRRGEPSEEVYGLELLHRALVQRDQDAWAGVQHCLSELVRGCCTLILAERRPFAGRAKRVMWRWLLSASGRPRFSNRSHSGRLPEHWRTCVRVSMGLF